MPDPLGESQLTVSVVLGHTTLMQLARRDHLRTRRERVTVLSNDTDAENDTLVVSAPTIAFGDTSGTVTNWHHGHLHTELTLAQPGSTSRGCSRPRTGSTNQQRPLVDRNGDHGQRRAGAHRRDDRGGRVAFATRSISSFSICIRRECGRTDHDQAM